MDVAHTIIYEKVLSQIASTSLAQSHELPLGAVASLFLGFLVFALVPAVRNI